MRKSKNLLIVSFLVSLLTIFVYLPALQNDFVNWDDNEYVYENPYIQSFNLKSIRWMLTSFHAANWHPLTWFSHAIDYAIWGLNPMGHHLTSVIFHGLNTFLVVVLITHLIRLKNENSYQLGYPLIAGAITGLLFGLHPLHVESVAWVSERKDVLYAFFFLLSILMYIKYVSAQQGRKVLFYGLCIGFFILSLMSKPMAVTLPVVLIILDFYPLERLNVKGIFTSHRKVIAEKLVFLGLSLASSVLTLQAQKSADAIKPYISIQSGERLLVAIRALIFYLYKMLWPTDLAPLYPYPSGISFFIIEYTISFAAFIIITALCIYSWKKLKVWTVAWAYYFVTLFPVLGIIKVGNQAAADRYMYLPSVGIFLLAGLGITELIRRIFRNENKAAVKGVSLIIGFLVISGVTAHLTVKQEKIWKNSMTLWKYELNLFPNSAYQAYYNLGNAYDSLGRIDDAILHYQRALQINPYYLETYNTLGALYQNHGRIDEAIKQYRAVLKLNSDFPDVYYNLGLAYQSKGLIDRSMEQYELALKLKPDHVKARYNLGNIYQSRGLSDEAIEQYKKVIKLDPLYFEAVSNLAVSYMTKGSLDEAILYAKKAININPSHPMLYYNLGKFYQMKGLMDKAIEQYRISIKIKPDYAKAQYNLGVIYQQQGLSRKANKMFETARELNPVLFDEKKNQR
jgi:tetratricopeptide (TPR) repeat protein